MKSAQKLWCVNESNVRGGLVALFLVACSVWSSVLIAGRDPKEMEELRARYDVMYVEGVRIKGGYVRYVNAVFRDINRKSNRPIEYYKFFVKEKDDGTVDVRVMIDSDFVERKGLPILMDGNVIIYTLTQETALIKKIDVYDAKKMSREKLPDGVPDEAPLKIDEKFFNDLKIRGQ